MQPSTPVLPNGITAAAVRAQVERICVSQGFYRSERLVRFLRFTVQHKLDGGIQRLKESLIGVEVCGRKQTFDPRLDPIVRVEARRLRTRLAEYYAGEGLSDPVIIDLPKGSYMPSFGLRDRLDGRSGASGRRWAIGWVAALAGLTIVAMIGVGLQFRSRWPGDLGQRTAVSVAIVPFVELDHAPDENNFSAGLTEELSSLLTKESLVRVVVAGAPFEILGARALARVTDDLQIDQVLHGSVRRSQGLLRITAHLTGSHDGRAIWADTYERKAGDSLRVQEEVAGRIVNEVRKQVLRNPREEPVSPRVVDPQAYQLYTQGRYHWSRRTEQGMKKALQCFRDAVALDSGYAKAYVGLADAYSALGSYGVLSPQECMPKARAAALKALEIDPHLGEAHASLGLVRAVYDWDWQDAEREFRRALVLNTNYAMAHKWYATAYLLSVGRTLEAVHELNRAQELDPLAPILRSSFAYALFAARQYDAAIEQSRQTLEIHPDFYLEHWNLGMALEQRSSRRLAVQTLEKAKALSEGSPYVWGSLAHAYASVGRTREAQDLLDKLLTLSKQRYISPVELAIVQLSLGRTESALDALEQGYRERATSLISIAIDPRFDPLRRSGRFKSLLERIGLKPPADPQRGGPHSGLLYTREYVPK